MPFDKSRAIEIVKEIQHRDELPWVELKENNSSPQEIGEYVSALANSAALYKQNFGFMVWGIDDKTREIKGTTFVPVKAKQGNQTLDLWIGTQLEPQVQFYFHTLEVKGHPVVLLEVAAAYSTPVKFRDIGYIRIGENKKEAKGFSGH
jgi:predicted HTH transcriptional regulator